MIGWTWEIIGALSKITVYGSLAHLTDIPIRWLANHKIRLFTRYGMGYVMVMPAFLLMLETLLEVGRIADDDPSQRRRLVYISMCAYVVSGVAFGIGVIIGHVAEQLFPLANGGLPPEHTDRWGTAG